MADNKKIQEALEARKKRKEASSGKSADNSFAAKKEASDSKIQAALRAREARNTANAQNLWDDLRSRSETAVKSYNDSISSPFWGKSVTDIYDSQRSNMIEVSNLMREAEAYRKYFGDEATDSLLASLKGVKSGQDSIYSSAGVYSQFKSEDDYDEYRFRSSSDNSNARQQRYQENQKRIAELKVEMDNAADIDWTDTRQRMAYYQREKEIKAEISRLETDMRNYERGNENYVSKTVDDYTKVTLQDDFYTGSANRNHDNPTREELSEYDALSDSSTWYTDAKGVYRDAYGNELSVDGKGNWINPKASSEAYQVTDRLGLYLNASEEDVQSALGTPADMEGTWESIIKDAVDGSWDQLTKNEVDIYYYLLNTAGQGVADKYLTDMKTELNRRQTMAGNQQMAEAFDEANALEKIALSAATVPAQLFSGVTGLIENTANTLMGNEINPYSAAHAGMHFSSTARGLQAAELDETGFAIPVIDFTLGDIYQTGMSRLDSLAAMGIGGKLGGALLATGAATSEATRLYEQGASMEQIAFGSAAAGAAEMVFESLSIDKLINMKDAKTVGQMIKNVLVQGGIEASEEGFTEISNILTNAIIMGSESDWAKLVEENGGDKWKAFLSEVQAVAQASFGGFLSGAGTASIPSAVSYGSTQAQYADTGRLINHAEGGVDALMSLANEVAGVTEGTTQKQLNKQTAAVGRNATNRRVGKLYETVQTANNLANASQNQADIAKSLKRKGFNSETANDIAEALVASYNGQELTKAQTKLLESVKNSKVVQDAISNIVTNEQSTIGQRSQNIRDFNSNVKAGLFSKATGVSLDVAKEFVKGNNNAVKESLAENQYEVSADGKTIDKNGNDVVITGVESIEGGKLILKTENGTIDASEVAFATKDEAFVYSAVANMDVSAASAWAIIKGFNQADGVSAQVYAIDIPFAYRYGKLNYKAGLQNLSLTPGQSAMAFQMGRDDAAVETTNQASTESTISEKNADKKIIFEGFTYNEKSAKEVQKASMAAIDMINKMSNLEVHVYKSYKKDGKLYAVVDGKERLAPNGYFTDGNKIYIDFNAGNQGEGLMLYTLSHEIGHYIAKWNAQDFKAISDFLFEHYGNNVPIDKLLEHQKNKLKKSYKEDGKPIPSESVLEKEAHEELVCDMLSRMLADKNAYDKLMELKQKDLGLFQKLGQVIKNILDKLGKLIGVYDTQNPDFMYAASVENFGEEAFRQLQDLYVRAFVQADANFNAAENIDVDASTKALDMEVDANTESVAPAILMSERTWTESDYVQEREKAAKEIAKAIGVSVKKAKAYIDSVNSIAKMIAEDRVRLDYFSSPGRSSFVGNVEYGGSFDFSTLCKKRRLLTGTFTAIQKALPNTALTANEILDIRNRMKEKGLEVSCGLCYVEGSRANMGQFAKEFLKLYKQYYPDAWQPNMADVNTPDGIEWVRINHPECYEQYEYFWNHYGTLKPGDKNLFASQQKPKLYQLHTEYKGEILEKFKDDGNVEDKNLNGGIRLQSFSDFEIVHLIDTMQIIMDMSRVGLAGQAYTKVPDFAWALGDTGLKINLSLIAKGVDENGKLIFDDVEGMPIDTAVALRNRYSKNVGTILVAFNDEQLLAAMADDRVDFIIPFHRSQWKKSQYAAMGLPAKTKDYTYMQNEKFIKPQYHEYRGRMVKDKATNYMPNEYWDFSKSGKENAEAYLEMCARNNKRPKFYKLLQNNGDGSYSLKADGSTDGYWKLLIDFKMYDNNGVGSPQMPVKPDFNMDEATRMLNEYSGGHSNFPVAQGIVDSFVQEYKDSHKGMKFSARDSESSSSDMGILYSQRDVTSWDINWDEDNHSSIKSQMVKHMAEINRMNTVADIEFDKSKGKTYANILDEVLRTKFGYKIDRADGASFLFDKVAIATLRRYVGTDEEAAAVTAAPYVLKRGKAISGHKNHKGNRYPSVTYAAPVTINGERVNVGVVVLFGDKNRPHSLRVLMPSGKEYVLKKTETDPKRKWASPDGGVQSSTGSASDQNVTQPETNVKKYSDRDSESVSNRSLLANAFEGVAQNDIEKQKIQEYKGKIDLINAEEQKLIQINEQIKELSFAKGPRDTKAIRDLQFEARQTANRINTYDKQLLRLEASKPLQDVLTREKKMAYQRAEKKGKEALEAYRERTMKTQRELLEKWQESRKKGIDSRHRTAMRHKIKDIVNELNQYLLRGTKDRHVPIELQKAVAEALDAVNMDTVGAEERIAKLKDELLKAKTPEQIQEISRKIDHIQEMGDRMNGRLQKLKDAYDQFVNSDDPLIANSHDEVISNKLQSVIDSIGNTPLRDMTLAQLEDVYDMYRMVLTTIRNANKAFKAKKSESISVIANQVMMEVEKAGGKKKQSLAMLNGIKSFGWNNLKPVYAFEHIGSDHFTEVFNNVRAGEDVWAVDVTEAREFYLDKSKKHNYDSWDFKKQYKFTSTSGMDFELSLEQIMSLYAYSKREQAADHLKKGGIVIDESTEITVKTKLGIPVKFNPTEATAYNISDETLADIISKLTDEQKSFVDEMQDYLSTVMGAKGNEVSLEMYGIKLFKEKFYFPLKSAHQFMAKAKEQAQGEVKIKNSGFSKETVQKASNPIVLTPFMNVWSNHVNEMSMYHAFVLPMEDFYRVYNYKTPTSDTMATESVEMFIQNAYGKGATKYIDQLLKDLNGGARTDSTTGIINKMMGLFKKGAVFASLSVVVQQPSAIARAAALVDTKYFIGPKVDRKRHKFLWDEVKQYAPVAIIKEMGYFDTNMGKSTQDFILGKEYSGFSEKMKALVTDSGYRDEVLSKAPALADELAWCSIWEAVKREMHDQYPGLDVKAEPFLMLCGSRFTEVIVKTQVYDSVLSRSALMRSKDTGMKMATSFMAEPTTSINMIADALLQGKRGNKKYARATIGAVIASQILNSILVSFVYAGRDDDEDETYVEKYIGTLTGEVLDSLNPAGYIPFIKDIMSIVQGYDVERSDMAVVSDLWNAWQNLSKDNVSTYRKVESFAGSIAQIFGLPVKNIMRDARGIYQTIMSFVNGHQTTSAGIGYAIEGAITGKTASDQQQLYEAYLSGDDAHLARVLGRYKDESAANSAMRTAIKAHFTEGDISSDTAISYLVEYAGMEEDDAYWRLQEWEYENNSDDEFGKYDKFHAAVETGKNLKAVIKEYTDNGVELKTLKSNISSHYREKYIEMTSSEKAGIKGYLLNAFELCGYDREDAADLIAEWEYESNHPELVGRITYSQYKRWQTDGKPRGVSIEVFTDVAEYRDDGTSDSVKSQDEVAEYINSLSISVAQKDALWCCFWKESTLKNAPWH